MNDAQSIQTQPGRIVSNVTSLGLSRIFSAGVMLIWQIVLARALGAATYGVYGTIGAMMAVSAAIPDLGAGVVFIRDVARRPSDASRYLAAAVALGAGLSVLAYGALQGAAMLLHYDAALRALLAFVGVNLLIDAIGTIAHNQFVAAERMRWVAAIGAAHVTLVVALGVLAISAGGGLWAVYIAAFAAGACRTVAFWTALRHCGWLPAFPVDRATVRRLFTGGLPLGVSAFLSLAFLHADKLATTTIIGAAATGQLVAAFVVVFGVVEVIGNTALVAAFPLMARAGGEASPARMHSIVLRLLSFDAFAALPATASLVVFGPAIASIFGQEFGGVAGLWSVMGWFILVHMAEGVLAQALIVRDRQTDVLFTRGGGLLLNLTVAVMLLPRIGVMGAAMGMLVGDAAVVGMMVGLLHPPAEWWRRMAREAMGVAAAGAVLFGVLLVLRPHVNMSVAILAALALYGGAAVAAGAARNVWTP